MTRIRNFIRLVVLCFQKFVYKSIYKMDIASSARISLGAKLDKTYPKGLHIGEESYIASGAIIFTHDYSRNLHSNTYIGNKCFIGANAIIMCGVKVGDEVIIGSGSVVTKDVESNTIVAGNPARVIKTGIKTKTFGQLVNYGN